jgi:S1/P1 Nuclease
MFSRLRVQMGGIAPGFQEVRSRADRRRLGRAMAHDGVKLCEVVHTQFAVCRRQLGVPSSDIQRGKPMAKARSHINLGRQHAGSAFLGIALALLFAQPRTALAWGPEGHQVVGSIADQLLHDHAKQEVANILGFELRVASTWPDCAKDVVRRHDGSFEYKPDPHFEGSCASFATDSERMVDYVSRNWSNCTYEDKPTNCHKAFHFADVAIQHDTYDRKDVGTSDHDVVSAINAIILVLQNKSAPSPFDQR